MKYAELHLHDTYSALDGVSSPEAYMARAKEIGITHMAQTNHGTHSGHRHFQRAAKEAGIIPILGEEGYFTMDRFDRTAAGSRAEGDAVYNHITLLAQNDTGLKNLRKMNEIAWSEGFYSKSRVDMEVLEAHNEGVIVLSGCLSGVLSKAIGAGNIEHAERMAKEFKRVFGERYFIEVMSHNPKEINAGLIDLAKKFGFKWVVTSDCHHARKEDLWVQEAMLILSTNPKVNPDFNLSKSQKMDWMERFNYLYPGRKMTFQDFDLHLNSVEEHLAGLKKHGIGQEALDNTMIAANMVDSESYSYYEGLDLLPDMGDRDQDETLRDLVFAGLEKHGLTSEEYIERANHELSVIKDKKFSPYFLIAEDIISYARSQGIRIGPGRGSGAGSLICYALHLTDVNPIEHGLIFERFIDPSREDWPDLDIDIEDAKREQVKAYARERFGHVASIMTFAYFKDKGTVRDASRALKIPIGEVNKALKKISDYDDFKKSPHSQEFRKKYPEVMTLAEALQGRLRSTGMHAGGLVISRLPLSDFVPVQTSSIPNKPSLPRVPVVAADMNEIADIGLIKYDFLGLKTLTIIGEAEALIRERKDKNFDINKVPLDDAGVYEMLSAGHTKGVFQCSQSPYTRMLVEMKGVKDFGELVVSNALVRPGASDSSFGAAYIQGKNGGAYEYIHADTEWFTRETYGQIIYQEQQMRLCTELAGMTMVEANKVRGAIGKKKPAELAKWKPRFIEGASEKISSKKAEALWKDLEAAANYSFNKSHAVAYSILSYQTAWMKLHYPLEFFVACMNNESDKDVLMDFLIETKRMGIRIGLPNVNSSGLHFEIQSDERGEHIKMGLTSIKFISDNVGSRIIEKAPYASYSDLEAWFAEKNNGLNSRALSALNAVGAAVFHDNPRRGNEQDNFYEYLSLPAFKSDLPPAIKMNVTPLNEYVEGESVVAMGMVREIKTGPNWARVTFVDESGTASAFVPQGASLDIGQMYVFLLSGNSVARYVTIDELNEGEAGEFYEFIAAKEFPDIPDEMVRVVAFNSRMTKAGARMADLIVCDNQKNIQHVLVFPSNYIQAYGRCREGAVMDLVFSKTKDGSVCLKNIL